MKRSNIGTDPRRRLGVLRLRLKESNIETNTEKGKAPVKVPFEQLVVDARIYEQGCQRSTYRISVLDVVQKKRREVLQMESEKSK